MTLLVAAIAATVTAILESTITQYLRVGDAQPHLVFVLAVIWTVAAGLDSGLVWAFVGGIALDTLAQRLALWQAAWRMAEELPADTEVAVAKLWAADAGHRLAHTTVHVHGGVGIDLDGEAHRYFTSAKRYEFLHGGATEQALHVGRTLAAEPA